MALTNYQALELISHLTNLRLNQRFQDAERLRRSLGKDGAAQMVKKGEQTPEYAAIWLLAATWERIAIFAKEFSKPQQTKFFRCAPAGLIWSQLEPAIDAIRDDERIGPTFAKEFEDLKDKYNAWVASREGQDYRSTAAQAVHALFG